MSKKARSISSAVVIAALALLLLSLFGTYHWLKAGYTQIKPRRIAHEFHQLLKSGNFQDAHQLTVKSGFVGRTPAELATIAKRHCLNADHFAYTFPFQSNGNRLRRWILGKEVEMDDVSVEFDGPCLLEIRIHHMDDGAWKISYFASHAG